MNDQSCVAIDTSLGSAAIRFYEHFMELAERERASTAE